MFVWMLQISNIFLLLRTLDFGYIGAFPLKYLGLALHWKKLARPDWQKLIDKILNRLPVWKGRLLSLGGRLILLNSVLSFIPLYYITMFKIPAWVLTRIDQLRKRFLWVGSDSLRRKYHLVKWATVCRPKDCGGWGILNLEFMNTSFLCKWYWKCRYINEAGLWQSIINFKYLSNSSSTHFSAFWKAVSSVSHFVQLGAKRIVGNGSSVNFWLDTWVNDFPLSLQYPLVYAKTKSAKPSVRDVWNNGNIKLNLCRGASTTMRHEKRQIITLLNSVQFTPELDSAIWMWESAGYYSIKSMYNFLCFGGVKTNLPTSVWALKIPLKNKLFLWMVLHNKILTKDNLIKRGWSGDTSCAFCTFKESVDHIFFNCTFITEFWDKITHGHPQKGLLNTVSLLAFWHSCTLLPNFQFWGTLLAASVWVIWLERNKRVFTSPPPSRAANIYFLIFSMFKHWTGSHTNLEHTLVMDRGPTAGSRAAAVPLAPLRGSQQADGAYSLHSEEDEDLLD
jgi:zinc-binding in reverse transcriptase